MMDKIVGVGLVQRSCSEWNEFLNELLERFSSYDILLRVLAVVLRLEFFADL